MTHTGLDYLIGRAELVEERIRALVSSRRQGDPAPDDPFRGLYLSDEAVDQLLSPSSRPVPTSNLKRRQELETIANDVEDRGLVVPLRRLARDAGLTPLDVELLVIALLPDLDSRFERLYGYLNDDVTRRRATIGLALELADEHPVSARARSRFGANAPLAGRLLLQVEDIDRPFLTRGLRVPDRVAGHLLGDDTPDPRITALTTPVTPYETPLTNRIARQLCGTCSLVYLKEGRTKAGASCAASVLRQIGRGALVLDLARCTTEGLQGDLVPLAGREALLQGAGLVAGPVEAVIERSPRALRHLAALPLPVLLIGHTTWDPGWTAEVPLIVDTPELSSEERLQLWLTELAEVDSVQVGLEPATVIGHFILGPDQTHRAVHGARSAASLTGGEVTAEHLRSGARAQNAAGLERLARRIEPTESWSDLVLPAVTLACLRDLAARARHRDLVLTQWRMRPGGGRGTGLTALFAGESGTGKTMSAEVIAAELGLDLYAVDLATVVDKYVGETEKNLERIFREAAGLNAVLLFDEADAIFGKRSEVRDAHDRYANIESAYLLQRMESFDGLAILSTNMRANIDEAFTRRLDVIVDFPIPDVELRLDLWRRCLAPPLPCARDLDLEFCAKSFELCGGHIRSVAITAAYLAASRDSAVTMVDIMSAMHQEYRKLGRLVVEREFGRYLRLP